GRVGGWESGRVGEWEGGRGGEGESGRMGGWESPSLQDRTHALACVAGHLEITPPSHPVLASRTLSFDAPLPVGDSSALRRPQFLILQNRLYAKLKLFSRQLNQPLCRISCAACGRAPRPARRQGELAKPDMSASAISLY